MRPYALGSIAELGVLHVTGDPHFSSFREMRTDLVDADLGRRATVREIEIDVRRLDEVWDDRWGRVLLKCDTQGYDLEVLRGAGERLAEVSVLQTEVSNRPIYQGMPDMLESIAAVRAAGFTVSGLFPLNGGPDFVPIEFDLLAVRPPGTGPAR